MIENLLIFPLSIVIVPIVIFATFFIFVILMTTKGQKQANKMMEISIEKIKRKHVEIYEKVNGIKCEYCGASILHNNKKCPSCGAQIKK